jgi:hypothetical protein
VIGRTVASLAPPEWRAQVDRNFAASRQGAWRGEFPLLHAEGHLVHLQWSLSPHVEPGVRIAIAIDVSERHELEQRRHEVLEREQAARAHGRTPQPHQGRFHRRAVARVAHAAERHHRLGAHPQAARRPRPRG